MSDPLLTVTPPLPPDVYLRPPLGRLPYPLAENACRLFQRARRGLYEGVASLGLRPGDEVLVPAWHHGSEVEALVRRGLVPRYYEGGPDLAPDEAELESLLPGRVRALHLIHYLGFPQDGARWRAWCRKHNLDLIEDAAQAWLATQDERPLGSFGDLAIFSLYKAFGLPDGGAVLCRLAISAPDARPNRGLGPLGRRHAAWLMGRSGAAARVGRRWYRRRIYDPAADFALDDAAPPSSVTRLLLSRAIDLQAPSRRRANYEALLEGLGERVPTPFNRVPGGASPFAFPVAVDDKPETLRALAERGIRAVDLWSVPHPTLPVDGFPLAAARRASVLALPVHHELRDIDLDRIVGAVRGTGRARTPSARSGSIGHASSRAGVERGAAQRLDGGDEPLRIDTAGTLESLAEPWDRLGEVAGNVFATREWVSRWWQHHQAAKRRLVLAACSTPRRGVVAILPLCVESKGPLRVARFAGYGAADQLGPVCVAGDRAVAGTGLQLLLDRGQLGADILIAERLKGDEGWEEALGHATLLRRDASPVIHFDGMTWEEFLADRSRKLRRQVRQRQRRLVRDHRVRFRLADDRDRLAADLDAFYDLHRTRWASGGSSLVGRWAFLRDFAYDAFDRGWLRLWFLEADGRPIAARYDLRFGKVHLAYNSGRDPAFSQYSPGLVLRAHTMERAIEEGVTEYRFLRGGEDYKYRFTEIDPGLVTLALGRGRVGRWLLAGTAPLASTDRVRAALR